LTALGLSLQGAYKASLLSIRTLLKLFPYIDNSNSLHGVIAQVRVVMKGTIVGD